MARPHAVADVEQSGNYSGAYSSDGSQVQRAGIDGGRARISIRDPVALVSVRKPGPFLVSPPLPLSVPLMSVELTPTPR